MIDYEEQAIFFGALGGRVSAERRFNVGPDFNISMMIKPRNITGILAGVKGRGEKGKGDYLLLHMVEGAIVFEVKSNEIIKTFHF